jgi:hypothetical protein
MQKYKEINGNDYVKDSRVTINETMQSIQSMNSGTAFPTTNLFEGMKCYRTDLKKTYTLTDVENNTWVEDAHATLSDEATHAASATKLQTARSLNLGGAVTADAATFDGTADATINVKTLDATKLNGTASVSTTGNAATATKLSAARKINITGDASGSAAFDGSGDVSISTTVNESKHAAAADTATKANDSDKLGGHTLTRGNMSYNAVPFVSDAGVMEIGKYIDWHATSGGTEDYSSRWTAETNGTVSVGTINGALNGNSATATKLATPRTISLTGNASGSATFDGSGDVSINTNVNYAAQAFKLAGESGNNYIYIDSTTDSWSVIGSNPGAWLKSIRTNASAPPYSIGNYSAAIAFGGFDTKGVITHAYDGPLVKFAGGNGSTAQWKFSIKGGSNNEVYDLNNFPTKTGDGASGTWPISISGNADTATNANHASSADNATTWNGIIDDHATENNTDTWIPVYVNGKMQHTDRTKMTVGNADTVDGYHASDLLSKIQDVLPKTAAGVGQFRELVVNDSHQVKLPDGGTWAYFVYTYYSWNEGDTHANEKHRTRTGAGIAAGGTVLHTDRSISSNTINASHLSGTTDTGGTDSNGPIVGGFCWRIA